MSSHPPDALFSEVLLLPGVLGEAVWAVAGVVGVFLTVPLDPFLLTALAVRGLQSVVQALYTRTAIRTPHQDVEGAGVQLLGVIFVANIATVFTTTLNILPDAYNVAVLRSVHQPAARVVMQWVFTLVLFNRIHSAMSLVDVLIQWARREVSGPSGEEEAVAASGREGGGRWEGMSDADIFTAWLCLWAMCRP